MANVVQASSQSELHQYEKRQRNMEDLISELPDEILVCIVSFLTMKEAMRSSILSSRWKCLWTFFTGNLEFEPSESVKKAVKEKFSFEALDSARRGLVTLVNQVLKSHKGPTVDKFKVCYDMGADYSSDIDRWINFAIERRVRALELDFQPHFENVHGKRYTFPSQFLKSLSFVSIRDLRLKFLNVTGEVVEYFLSNCPFLETLCVEHSKCLVNLKISSPSLKLLIIHSCNELQNLEISASNLRSFVYGGPTISRPFKNVPCLVKLCLGGNYCASITSKFRHISRVLSRIKGLALLLDDEVHFRYPKSFKLSNLMYLELQLNIIADDGKCLLSCMSLIKAAPLLHTFVLKPSSRYYLQGEVKISDAMKFPHQCLKEVEVVGLVWYRPVVELTKCLIKNAVSLERVILNPCDPYSSETSEIDINQMASDCARELTTELDPGTEMVIL